MKAEITENKTIDIIKNLSESNAQLIRMTDDGIGEALNATKRYMELIQHCGKIYQYLNAKNDKTWMVITVGLCHPKRFYYATLSVPQF